MEKHGEFPAFRVTNAKYCIILHELSNLPLTLMDLTCLNSAPGSVDMQRKTPLSAIKLLSASGKQIDVQMLFFYIFYFIRVFKIRRKKIQSQSKFLTLKNTRMYYFAFKFVIVRNDPNHYLLAI